MSEQKPKPSKSNAQNLVKTIRNGAIAASIWKRQTSTGFEYLDYSLSRSWKLKSGEKEGYSSNFFPGNEDALVDVVQRATDYIRENSIEIGAASSQEGQQSEAPTPN